MQITPQLTLKTTTVPSLLTPVALPLAVPSKLELLDPGALRLTMPVAAVQRNTSIWVPIFELPITVVPSPETPVAKLLLNRLLGSPPSVPRLTRPPAAVQRYVSGLQRMKRQAVIRCIAQTRCIQSIGSDRA